MKGDYCPNYEPHSWIVGTENITNLCLPSFHDVESKLFGTLSHPIPTLNRRDWHEGTKWECCFKHESKLNGNLIPKTMVDGKVVVCKWKWIKTKCSFGSWFGEE